MAFAKRYQPVTFACIMLRFCCLDHCDVKDENVVDSKEIKENVMLSVQSTLLKTS